MRYRLLLLLASFIMGAALSITKAQEKKELNLFSWDVNLNKLNALIRGDVIEYFGIEKRLWDSPLKKQRYLSSEDAEEKRRIMVNHKEYYLDKKYYICLEFNNQYDLNSGCFPSFDFLKENLRTFRNMFYVTVNDPKFSFDDKRLPTLFFSPIRVNEDTAYEIEMASKCYAAIVFKLTGNYSYEGTQLDYYYNQDGIYRLELVPDYVQIFDMETGKIFYRYSVK